MKNRIQEQESYMIQPYGLYPWRKLLMITSLIYKSVVQILYFNKP